MFLQKPEHNNPEQGLVLLFHGCSHNGADWFDLPEERQIVHYLLSQNYAVLAISSQERTGAKCWNSRFPATANADAIAIMSIFTDDVLQDELSVPIHEIPLFAIGASSGGTFVTILRQELDFTGMEVIVSPGNEQAFEWLEKEESVRDHSERTKIAFVYMPKDLGFASESKIKKQQEILQSYPVRLFPCREKPITAEWLYERTKAFQNDPRLGLSMNDATDLVRELQDTGIVDKETNMLLHEPRGAWNAIEAWCKSKRLDPILIESIKELLNLAGGKHELTSDHIDTVLQFWLGM